MQTAKIYSGSIVFWYGKSLTHLPAAATHLNYSSLQAFKNFLALEVRQNPYYSFSNISIRVMECDMDSSPPYHLTVVNTLVEKIFNYDADKAEEFLKIHPS